MNKYEKEFKTTNTWDLYEIGKNYNRRLGMYAEGKENYDYYHGRQWEGLNKPKSQAEPVTLNIVKPIIKYKSTIVKQNNYEFVFNPNTYATKEELAEMEDIAKGLTQFASRTWEKAQGGKIVRSIVSASAINSEGILYQYVNDDKNAICLEEIDKNNIYYGNENEPDIQAQPYILITYRKPVSEVKRLARVYKDKKLNSLLDEEIDGIVSDIEIEEQQGRDFMQDEVSPMCLVIKKFQRMDDGEVWYSESTRTCEIIRPQRTKCKLYPVAHYTWEHERGYARGVSEVRGLIENQREINKTATRRAIAVKLGAYPKLVVASDFVKNKNSFSQVGSTIEVNGMKADDVRSLVTYLNPAQISPDAYNLQNDLISSTRELAGAGDTATGQIDPERSSGKAILAIQQASQQPINEQLENFKYFLEDCAKIMYELIKVYFSQGLNIYTVVESYNELGQVESFEQPLKITKAKLEKIDMNLKIDITPTTAYDKYAQELSLENLLLKGLITIEEYTLMLPQGSAMPKDKLENMIEKRRQARAQIAKLQQQANAMMGAMQQVIMENEGQMMGGDANAMQDVSSGGTETLTVHEGQ
jgi:hypothetical protein